MIEKVMYFTADSDEKQIEKILNDGNAMINHFVLPQGTGIPPHNSNSNVYMIIVRGTLSLTLGDEQTQTYEAGHLLSIPYDVPMVVRNEDVPTLEMFVIKAPSPDNYKGN